MGDEFMINKDELKEIGKIDALAFISDAELNNQKLMYVTKDKNTLINSKEAIEIINKGTSYIEKIFKNIPYWNKIFIKINDELSKIVKL